MKTIFYNPETGYKIEAIKPEGYQTHFSLGVFDIHGTELFLGDIIKFGFKQYDGEKTYLEFSVGRIILDKGNIFVGDYEHSFWELEVGTIEKLRGFDETFPVGEF